MAKWASLAAGLVGCLVVGGVLFHLEAQRKTVADITPGDAASAQPKQKDSGPVWYIGHITDRLKDYPGINATTATYSVKKTGDSTAPLLAEIDFTVNVDTGADGTGLAPSSVPLSFKATLSFQGTGWKVVSITDTNGDAVSDDSDIGGYFHSETGYTQPVFHYSDSSDGQP